jgi:isopentenyl phosphate kinase
MLVFVKLGGSLITDKQNENSFRADVMARLAADIRAAREATPDLQLLLGHGSGSFGHVAARRFGTMQGVATPEQWRGFAHVATVASELSQHVARTLDSAGVPVWKLQPSASAMSHDSAITQLAVEPIRQALDHGLVPLVHGDVSLDEVRGGTILSTETIFFYLAQHLPVDQILLLGDVEGVYDAQGDVIPRITPENYDAIESALGGSAGVDVTGGMETKVRDMLALVRALPGLTIRIMSGKVPGLLADTLSGKAQRGTVITAPN